MIFLSKRPNFCTSRLYLVLFSSLAHPDTRAPPRKLDPIEDRSKGVINIRYKMIAKILRGGNCFARNCGCSERLSVDHSHAVGPGELGVTMD